MSSSPSKGRALIRQDSNETHKQMTGTYTAVEVSAHGMLRVVERRVSEPGPGQVRIRVEACGICHTDAATVTGTYPGLTLPRVPGHEVVGRIEALGSGVSRWKIGQRVGVGFFGGEDGVCEPCRRGDIVNCQNPVIPGVTVDGGYAEVMIAEARGIASIPDELRSAEAAPLLCAGITTYNALRNAGLRGGDLVAVQGIGGLGHLGIQFARHMGFHTVAVGRGREKEKLARDLGAHVYIDTAVDDAAAPLRHRRRQYRCRRARPNPSTAVSTWTREGKACEGFGRARLHRYCRRRCRSGAAAYGRRQGDSRNSSQW